MPRRPKYPLKALLEHRDRKVDDATAGLGEAVRTREATDEKRARLERAQKESTEAAEATRAAEQRRLAEGELRVADLARTEAWEVAVRRTAEDLARAVDRAAGEVETAKGSEAEARAALARTKADRDVVEKDRTRFTDGLRRAADAADEEEAAEAWRGNRGTK
jgi:hypothetical protein